MPHVKMTRSIQFRGRALDEGKTYEVTLDEHTELATYGSHVAAPAPRMGELSPAILGREAADASPETESAQTPTVSGRRRRA